MAAAVLIGLLMSSGLGEHAMIPRLEVRLARPWVQVETFIDRPRKVEVGAALHYGGRVMVGPVGAGWDRYQTGAYTFNSVRLSLRTSNFTFSQELQGRRMSALMARWSSGPAIEFEAGVYRFGRAPVIQSGPPGVGFTFQTMVAWGKAE
jgi:hypothetical protein